MRISLRAGGIIRKGPERELIDDYITRAKTLARAHGILTLEEVQIDLRSSKNRMAETRAILGNTGCAHIIVLDERGKSLTSRNIAKRLETLRDNGHTNIVFAIGGADGFEPSALPKSVEKWSFGPQTWPHKFVRVMIAEQIYRALSIMSSTPYHRD